MKIKATLDTLYNDLVEKSQSETVILDRKLDKLAEKLGFDLKKETTGSLLEKYNCGFKEGMGLIFHNEAGGPWGLTDDKYGAISLKFAYLCDQIESRYNNEHPERHSYIRWEKILDGEDKAVLEAVQDSLRPHFIPNNMDIAGIVQTYNDFYTKINDIKKKVCDIENLLKQEGRLTDKEILFYDRTYLRDLEDLKDKCGRYRDALSHNARTLLCVKAGDHIKPNPVAITIKEAIESKDKIKDEIAKLEANITEQVQESIDALHDDMLK